ncbi:MAG TPA: hypothetical protein VNB59_07440 [Solirubrobacterales bacterium]|jgi:hypothetical protein|nr:hypothetical protein [Solirubrobacterales bacterium]
MADQALLAFAEAAERGEEMPGICLFTGVLSIFGSPITSAEAQNLMKESLAHTMLRSESRRRRRKDAVAAEAHELAEGYLARFGSAVIGDSGGLSLGDAELIVTPTSERISVSTVRVSLDAVNAWFVGDFKSSSGGSSGFAGFVAFPGN